MSEGPGETPGGESESDLIRTLVVAGHSDDAETAARGLDHPSPAVRAAALGAMARLIALTPDQIAAGVADEDQQVRRRACEAAAQTPRLLDEANADPPNDEANADPPIDEANADPRDPVGVALLSALADPEPLVAEMAAWALGELEPATIGSVPALSEVAISHDDPLVRESAAAALGSLGLDQGLPAILGAMTDIATVRRRAVLALAPFDTPEVSEALELALTDRDWQVRQGAEDLLGDQHSDH